MMLDDVALIGRGRIDLEDMHSVDTGGLPYLLDHFRQRLFEVGGAEKFLRAHRHRFEGGVPTMRCEDRKRIIELARRLDRFRPHLRLALPSHRAPKGGRERGIRKTPHAIILILSERYRLRVAAIVQIVTDELPRR